VEIHVADNWAANLEQRRMRLWFWQRAFTLA
jgi:hypothetical protein